MGLFSEKTKLKTPYWNAPLQKTSYKDILSAAGPGALQRLNLAGTPYPGGDFEMTEYEKTGLGDLEKWLQSSKPTESKLWGLSTGELEKTLGGEAYDPYEGQYYEALRTNVLRELEEAKDRLHATTSSRDRYFSSGRVAGEGELEESAVNSLAMVMGQLAESERQRRLEAVNQAMAMTQMGETLPLTRVAASQEYGGLPREIEMMNYQEWIRQLTDLGIPLEVALQMTLSQPNVIAQQSGGGGWSLLGSLLGYAGQMGGVGNVLGDLGMILS